MTPAERYAELEKRWLEIRDQDKLELEQETVLDEMDKMWWKMTDAEHEEANRRAAAWARGVR